MNMRQVTIGALVAAGVLLGLVPGPQAQAQAPAPETGGQVGAFVLLGADQNVGVQAGATSSDIPNFTLGARGAQAADDIVITTAATNVYWWIQQITVSGGVSGGPTVTSLNLNIYNDSAGLPGSLYTAQTVTSFSNAPNYVISTSLFLPGSPSGRKYWLSIQANVSSTDGSAWSWQSSSSGALGSSESAWRETVGTSLNFGTCALATGIPTASGWGARRTQCGIGLQDNLAFRLDGQILTLSNAIYLPIVQR